MKTFNIEEAAEFLGAHKETVRRLAVTGLIPGAKVILVYNRNAFL